MRGGRLCTARRRRTRHFRKRFPGRTPTLGRTCRVVNNLGLTVRRDSKAHARVAPPLCTALYPALRPTRRLTNAVRIGYMADTPVTLNTFRGRGVGYPKAKAGPLNPQCELKGNRS
ncbi:hypothetical protein CBM2585_B30048 [Cupriavidus taiwanensis]|nr:hypothetical protein CBM2585_B30048 [Cupriavidus taiwanensis]